MLYAELFKNAAFRQTDTKRFETIFNEIFMVVDTILRKIKMLKNGKVLSG